MATTTSTMLREAALLAEAPTPPGVTVLLAITSEGVEVRGTKIIGPMSTEGHNLSFSWEEVDAAQANVVALGVSRVRQGFGL